MGILHHLVLLAGIIHSAGAQNYVRLTAGFGQKTERIVEVSKNGTDWGYVCDGGWTDTEATVVCRMLGFKFGVAHSYFPQSYEIKFGKVFLDNVRCVGTESSLGSCLSNGWGNITCVHSVIAEVDCYTQPVRLLSRGRQDVGTVQVYHNKGWVEVCDQDWGSVASAVLCREMGFVDGIAQCCSTLGLYYTDKYATISTFNTSLTHFRCTGHEKTLLDCAHAQQFNSCSWKKQLLASVICYYKPLKEVDMSFAVRLGNGLNSSRQWGEVNVRYKGVWGQVCAMEDKSNNNAKVVCKQLGFVGGVAYATVNETFMPRWIVNLNCTGKEKSLEHCSMGPLGQPHDTCEVAFVLCYQKGIDIKLVDGGAYYGRVEITHDQHTGTICDEEWSKSEAEIVCKYLNYADGEPVTGSYYGGGSGPVMMSGLDCRGHETSLFQCINKGWMTYNGSKCEQHKNDASVICYNNVKLSGGFETELGAVLVYNDKSWYAVCDTDFDFRDARVVCRTLGFKDGKPIPGSSFGNVKNPIGVNSVRCDGEEKEFQACKTTFSPDCLSGMYASVNCSHQHSHHDIVDKGFQVRIKPDNAKLTSYFHGFLEVLVDGVWGSVCSSEWDDRAAGVACRSLGFRGGYAYRPPYNFTSPLLMDRVKCKGMETSLQYCSYATWDKATGCDFYTHRAGVFCNNDTGLEFRLGAGDPDQGRVEIRYNGVWGGICDWLWDSRDAQVFCRNLGYADGLKVDGARYGQVDGPLWFTKVSCVGDETSVLQCLHTGFNSSDDIEGVYAGLCNTRSHDAAARCFAEKLGTNF